MTDIVEFREALEWAERRGVVLPNTYYTELPAESRAFAFTVSYLSKLGIIQEILDSLTEALDSGLSFIEWRDLPISGLQSLQPFHIETIYRNFMQTAFQIGHWEQFERGAERRPYLLYSTIRDGRETDLCRGLDGIIRRWDDAFWSSYAPPNHHNCRSSVISLTESQAMVRSETGNGLYKDVPRDGMGNQLNPPEGWDHAPTAAKATMEKLLQERITALSSISPDLADLFKKLSERKQ